MDVVLHNIYVGIWQLTLHMVYLGADWKHNNTFSMIHTYYVYSITIYIQTDSPRVYFSNFSVILYVDFLQTLFFNYYVLTKPFWECEV